MIKFGADFSKLKKNLKLAITRLKILEVKKREQTEKLKSEIASLLKNKKYAQAKKKTQKLIKDKETVEAMELIKMHCEDILEKYDLLQQKTKPDILVRPVSSLMWIAPYYQTHVQELEVIAKQLRITYGPRFYRIAMENKAETVDPDLVKRVTMVVPSDETTEDCLRKISLKYDIKYEKRVECMKDDFHDVKHCEYEILDAINQEKKHPELRYETEFPEESTDKKAEKILKKKFLKDTFKSKIRKSSEEKPDKVASSNSNKSGVITDNSSFDGKAQGNQISSKEITSLALVENDKVSFEHDFSLINNDQMNGMINNISGNATVQNSQKDENIRECSFIPTAPPLQSYTPAYEPAYVEPPPPYTYLHFNNTSRMTNLNQTTNEYLDLMQSPSCSTYPYSSISTEDVSAEKK